ncbi:MAG: lycopene cyclase domain-containing protein [Sphingobacteriaceae bacterium]
MKGTYLLINTLTILFPLLLSFDKKVRFVQYWKHLIPSLVLTGLVFLIWDLIFTWNGVWSFNPDYVLGIYFQGLPLEEMLFVITVPFACIFIYEGLNHYIKTDVLASLSRWISIGLMLLSITLLFLYYDRIYTLVTFGLLLPLLIYIRFVRQAAWLSRFYLAYLVSLLPFYIVNGLLTSIPVVMYNDAENMAIRVGTIPFEDHFYSLALLLMNMLFFEYFKKRSR